MRSAPRLGGFRHVAWIGLYAAGRAEVTTALPPFGHARPNVLWEVRSRHLRFRWRLLSRIHRLPPVKELRARAFGASMCAQWLSSMC